MKYALFEFVSEKACEIGETRWITRENPDDFNNKSWDTDREVMVAWPTEFTKVSKKIIKSSIDPSTVTTTTCVARVLKFSDDYETIRQHMNTYIDTGSTNTPSHGRGQRTSRKTSRYEELEEDPETEVAKTPKRQKKQHNESTSRKAIDALKAKYNLSDEKDDCTKQIHSDDIFQDYTPWEDSEDEIAELKKKNANLEKEMQKKDKQIAHLHSIINNLKEIPSLLDVVSDLRKQVKRLKDGGSSSCSSVSSSPSLATGASSRSRSPSLKESTDSEDTESDLVSFGPNVKITKAQYQVIRSKGELKDYVYSVMGMIWNREVLCTHSMTGKVSNAFREKDAKPQLDKEKVQSICEYGAKRFGCKPDDVRKVMISRINNICKVEKAKEKASQK